VETMQMKLHYKRSYLVDSTNTKDDDCTSDMKTNYHQSVDEAKPRNNSGRGDPKILKSRTEKEVF
jgi:hypothetical protein